MAALCASKRGLAVEEFHADWDAYGKRAGLIRNQKMISTVHGLVAFWDGKSTGTRHAIECAKKRGIWYQVRDAEGNVIESGGKS